MPLPVLDAAADFAVRLVKVSVMVAEKGGVFVLPEKAFTARASPPFSVLPSNTQLLAVSVAESPASGWPLPLRSLSTIVTVPPPVHGSVVVVVAPVATAWVPANRRDSLVACAWPKRTSTLASLTSAPTTSVLASAK